SRAPRPPGSTPLRVPQAEPVAWPRHLRLVAAWSGESASTPAMLGRLRAFREKDPAGFDSHMGRLGANAGRAVAAWADDDMAALLTAIDGYESGLRQLDEAARIGIFSPAHERLREIARRHGAVYKPSGAGGGDFGIAVTDSPEVERALRRAYVDAGVPLLDVELCAPGLRVACPAWQPMRSTTNSASGATRRSAGSIPSRSARYCSELTLTAGESASASLIRRAAASQPGTTVSGIASAALPLP
ncbi:MAG: hypothetical protein DYH20_06730, partial [Gammaproteobacteria bacterium PRO9]|nr:hypothetical protein [Gammaproteobacteria bacterium PRO9]